MSRYIVSKMIYSKVINKLMRFRKLIACTTLVLLCVQGLLRRDLRTDLYSIYYGPLENTSCHYIETDEETMPHADGIDFTPSSRSIFFLETSCRGKLNPKQACAVESAARAHPDWQINVLFAGPVTHFAKKNGSIWVLRNMPNIKFSRVHVEKYAKRTPLEPLVSSGALKRTRWRISHSSDVLRYLTLYKFGGVYLDLDVLVAKPFDSLVSNWAAREGNHSTTYIGTAVLAFSRDKIGRDVAEAAVRYLQHLSCGNFEYESYEASTARACARQQNFHGSGSSPLQVGARTGPKHIEKFLDIQTDIKSNYRGDEWIHNGPGVITRVLGKRCASADPLTMSAATCNGFEVYGPELFYPLYWNITNFFFGPGSIDDDETPYTFHVWNSLSNILNVHKDSPYAKLARKYCPNIYKLHEADF